MNKVFNSEEFEKEWRALAQKICADVLAHPQIQELKAQLDTNGFLNLEQKSEFITAADKIKYDLIFEQYGSLDSDTYKQFRSFWQEWLKSKGVASMKVQSNTQSNVDHFLYGSTPDPEKFLKEFNS